MKFSSESALFAKFKTILSSKNTLLYRILTGNPLEYNTFYSIPTVSTNVLEKIQQNKNY